METAITCKNCGEQATKNFCANCGQKTNVGKFTLRVIWQEFLDALFNVNQGLLPTVRDLTIRPGHMLRNYLDGQRKKYIGPVRFIIATAAVSYLLYFGLMGDDVIQSSINAGVQPSGDPEAEQMSQWLTNLLTKNYTFVVLGMAPFFALGYRMLFYRHKFSFADFLVVVTYTSAYSAILPLPLVPFLLTNLISQEAYIGIISLMSVVYTVVAIVLVLQPRNVFWGGFKALLGTILGILLCFVFAFLIGIILGLIGLLG